MITQSVWSTFYPPPCMWDCMCRIWLCIVEDVIGTSCSSCSYSRMPSATVSADHRHQHCYVCHIIV